MRYSIPALLILLLATLSVGTAQTYPPAESESDSLRALRPNLRVVGRSYGDSIVLRWGTTTHTAWKVAGEKGYMVERYEYGKDPSTPPTVTLLTQKPIRPLTVEEWKARYRPEDTLAGAAVQALHGRPIVTSDDPFGSIYEIYLQQTNMHGFALMLADMAPRIADGLGLRFTDRNVDRNKTYMYRIYSLASNPDEPIDTAFVFVTGSEMTKPASVRDLKAAEGEKEVVLKWNRFEVNPPLTGYFIERSEDGGKSFRRLNSTPYIPAEGDDLTFTDETARGAASYKITLEENYRPMQYRVVGFDAFGELSPESSVITAMGRDRTAPVQPRIGEPRVVNGRSLTLTWRLDSVVTDLKGFSVAKSRDVEGPFEPIGELLPKEAREFTDINVGDLPQHYYTVAAVDTAGNMRSSVPVLGIFPDSTAPDMPRGLAGTIDSNGVVTLSWAAGGERDLLGYRVFFANQEDHEFQQLTTEISDDTLFVDSVTLTTLSEEVYYRVTALDRNYNHSPFTETLRLQKPDIVPPAPPMIADVMPGERNIALRLHRSPSDDVRAHLLLRRIEGTEKWEEIASINDTSTTVNDTSAAQGTLYEYTSISVDDVGRRSRYSNSVAARRLVSGVAAGVDELRYEIDKQNRRIVLRWNGHPPAGAEYYIYRGMDGSSPSLIRSLPAASTEFVDREVAAGGRYSYGIKVVAAEGESTMTVTESIAYE